MKLRRKTIMLFTAVTAALLFAACNLPVSKPAQQSFAAPSVASPAVIVISAATQPPPPPLTPTPTPIPTPTPVPTPSPIPTPFSIVWLADTQTLTMHQPETLTAMGKWIADNTEAKNILCVVQTGDSVENGFNPRYWENFDCCYLQFADRLPYVPVAGNHDIAVQRHSYEAFLARPYFSAFPPDALFENAKRCITS